MKHKIAWSAAVCAAVIALDRISKHYVMNGGANGVTFMPGVARANTALNMGVAFGALSGGGWAVCALSAAIMAGIVIYLLRHLDANYPTWIALSLIMAGGMSNLFDRLMYGYVIDFIELTFVKFAIFNVADMAVVLGAIGLCVCLLRQGGES